MYIIGRDAQLVIPSVDVVIDCGLPIVVRAQEEEATDPDPQPSRIPMQSSSVQITKAEETPNHQPTLPTPLAELLYNCSQCREKMPLEENSVTLCQCGWRILTKTKKQEIRSFSTD